MLSECFETDFLDEEHKRNVMLTWFMQCPEEIEKRTPMIIDCDLPSGRELVIDRLCDSLCWNSIRFRKSGLQEIFDGSGIPAIVRLENRQKVMDEAVFLVTLYELAYPNTQAEVGRHLGLIVSSTQPLVSRMITNGLNHMLRRWLHSIQSDGNNHNALAMWSSSAEYMVNCVRMKNEGRAHERFDSVGMFIDGTFNFTCRLDQREEHSAEGRETQRCYFGGHGLKYLHCVWASGMIAQVWGPVDGRRHDGHLLMQSEINEKLANLGALCACEIHAHGDSAFPARSHVQKGCGYEMSRKRICVEWTIGYVTAKWAALDFDAHNQIYLNQPGTKYLLACILTNFHTCLYGCETGKYFVCNAPTLAFYMSM